MSRLHHVANGTSTTTTIEAAGIPGTTSIWADPLHDGPVPGGIDDAALLDVRREFHSGSPAASDPKNDMKEWRRVIADHDAYDELVLWFEHDLFDQVNLIQLLVFIRAHVPKQKPVSLICINSFPGRSTFHGLGELEPHELASLFPTRRRVGPPEHHLADRAWRAFRADTPQGLEILLSSDLSPLPFLKGALRRFLEDYPWTSDGLSRTERRLMTLAAEGRADWPAVFPRMIEGEDAFYLTDTGLIELTEALTAGATPLLVDTNGVLSLTPAGHDVLAGRADRVDLCGIDRWFGGVYMQGHETAWRWDGERQHPVPWW